MIIATKEKIENMNRGVNIYYIFGHAQNFRSHSFGHLESVMLTFHMQTSKN